MKKKYHLNKKETLYWANKARRYLKLPKIQIYIAHFDNLPIEMGVEFDLSRNELLCMNLCQIKIDVVVFRGYDIELNKLNSKEHIILAIFHEMAHYFQYFHHNEWFNRYATSENYLEFQGNHQNKKLEKNADKIAEILYKKLYLNS